MNSVKKLLYFLSFLIFITSCTKEDPNGPDTIDRTANLLTTGKSAADLVSDAKYTSMNIEIVYVEGSKPQDRTIAAFKDFLESRIYKPDGINIMVRSVGSSGKAPFEISEIAAIEKAERTAYNAGDEIALYIYFADGSNEDDTAEKFVLGSSFRNTSMVIYEKTIQAFANRPGAPPKYIIETATLNHEFGHLFGLVNLGTPMVQNHEDPDNDGHCSTGNCLMRASLEFGFNFLNEVGQVVPELQGKCIEDLQSIGGK
ncbi:hypothetical protein [Gramella sp. AN32]|uniref:Membrane metalloprotease n=1 Tax=Christiangramia antarctica TaxID=2058158 RepID=A0ABW5X8K7_9FLAO|nr:hypothetical protein [Gramella sp. AN32]MCM4154667.1 hypothetical protein [Gramella sp. AN32]